jgi:hypothetical protein
VSSPVFIRRSKSFVGDSIGDVTIVVNIVDGTYYSLTPQGGRVWALASETPQMLAEDLFGTAAILARETIIEVTDGDLTQTPLPEPADVFAKYTDMADILMADPIHDVDDDGWPTLR